MDREWHATYRLQLHAGFPLGAAVRVLPYLAKLGVSHVYLSPCLQAAPGSTHGYDVTDPTHVSADLGGGAGWKAFSEEARRLGLGVLLDVVPNHMAATERNPWWNDVLKHGPASRYAGYFDIFPNAGSGRWQVHLATLGSSYREALEQRQLQLAPGPLEPRLQLGEQSWPLQPASWGLLLPSPAAQEAFAGLKALVPRARWKEDDRAAYEADCAAAESLWAVNAAAAPSWVNGINRDPARLDAVIAAQYYTLHHWRREGEVTNYRRFFDVGSLVGIRMQDPAVWTAHHARVATMVKAGELDGLRIDHPDGLADPRDYFRRVREMIPHGRIYAEKILENDERLRADWPVDGTVGYDFLSKVNRLWMEERSSDPLSAIYADFTGHPVNLPRVVREKKTDVLAGHFTADLDRLADVASALAASSWRTRDLSPDQLRVALGLLTIELPIYRTYRDGEPPGPIDREVLSRTLAVARSQAPAVEPPVFDFLEEVFLGQHPNELAQDLVTRWQQLTPAVMAKGVEDTTFYCYDRLVACNEVGAQASLLGISSDQFHEFCHHLADHWPGTLLATSTHDTKRSEDVRARICVLTEDTARWGAALREWGALNLPAWQGREPDRHLEYLLYQTLVGAWPLPQDRAWTYVLKACREAKINTSWRAPNAAYELAIQRFVEGIYASPAFQTSLEAFVQPLILPGRINSLAQTLIKLTAPGVPDLYQGTELWDLSLVDPDNRRPVDFEQRQRLLAELAAAPVSAVWPEEGGEGRAKWWLIACVLALRRAQPAAFARGSPYQPVAGQGTRLGHLLGFLRGGSVLTLVQRFAHTVAGDWGNTLVTLPAGSWRNELTGAALQGDVTPGELFRDFPVAVLVLQP